MVHVPWVPSVGFTAVYATVAVKLFRIYKLHAYCRSTENFRKPFESKMLRDSLLLEAIAALIVHCKNKKERLALQKAE